MIKSIHCRYFKRFADQTFDLSPLTLLAGPNNSGKSTLLHAIMVWNLALQKWLERRGPDSKSKAKERTGVPITRQEFTAIPLPSMDQLWTDTYTALKKDELGEGQKLGAPRVMSITLQGEDNGQEWEFGFEIRHSGPEQIHVKPREGDLAHLATVQRNVAIVYVPPFSGISVNETRHDRPYQDMLLGQGKAGEIIRNLLLAVSEHEDPTRWTELSELVETIFRVRLKKPRYGGSPYIACDYWKGIPDGPGSSGLPVLDISTAGTGFHQVLLILGFLFSRKSSLILLDEPDAHLHVILQKQVYDRLRSICLRQQGQLVLATHAEVFIDDTDPTQIVSFFDQPHRLLNDTERDRVREALKRITSLDLLLAEKSDGVLYVEGHTDFNLLKAWARVLKHESLGWFESVAFWHDNQGCHPKEAKDHFFALRGIRAKMRGVLLLDGDNRNLPDREVKADGLEILRWDRYEAESYLLHPASLSRFAASKAGGELFAQGVSEQVTNYLRGKMPPDVFQSPLADTSGYFEGLRASKTLLPDLFTHLGLDVPKSDYFLIAETMRAEELPAEVNTKLNAIWAVLRRTV
ncbi:MAG: AAA family ATPase [Verrucomicrobia bacterium]|nr:AAA family ATPase [Verrucomicrobiota bacterium]